MLGKKQYALPRVITNREKPLALMELVFEVGMVKTLDDALLSPISGSTPVIMPPVKLSRFIHCAMRN